MSNQSDHTIVRLRVPPKLKQQIEESAEKNNRSQSAEMVAVLEESYEKYEDEKLNLHLMTEVFKDQERKIDELLKLVQSLKKENH